MYIYYLFISKKDNYFLTLVLEMQIQGKIIFRQLAAFYCGILPF